MKRKFAELENKIDSLQSGNEIVLFAQRHYIIFYRRCCNNLEKAEKLLIKNIKSLENSKLRILYDYYFEKFDEVAEEFKMKGQYPLAKLSDYLKHATVKEIEPKDFTIPEVVASIKEDMELMLADARKIREVAAAEDDFTISNLMEDHVAYYVKQLWFLEAMSK